MPKIFEYFRRFSFGTVARFFLYLFVFFLPFQINALVFTRSVYENFFFNPYLSHFIYLSDVCLVVSLLFLGLSFLFDREKIVNKFSVGDKKLFILLAFFVASYFISIIFSIDKLNSLFYALRISEFFIFYILVINKIIDVRRLFCVFIAAMSVCAGIGLAQYILQHSVGLSFLGEPVISNEMLGVAKVDFLGEKILRAYATFPHPNIFGGYLAMSILMTIFLIKESASNGRGRAFRIMFAGVLALLVLALLVTFSRSAMLALAIALVVYLIFARMKFNRKFWMLLMGVFGGIILIIFLVGILFPDFWNVFLSRIVPDNALSERRIYLGISWRMFLDNPLGVGAGNFTLAMGDYSNFRLMPWMFQPVHNIYLLFLNELGILGGGIFVVIFIYMLRKFLPIFILIFVIGFFDHYLISLYQGIILFWIFLVSHNFAARH